MKIKVKTRHSQFDLDFSGKFNFLLGKSGTRKTLLVTILSRWVSGTIASNTCKIVLDNIRLTKDMVIVLVNGINVVGDYHDLFKCSGKLIVIDESSPLLKKKDISSVLKSSNNYFLIISRTLFGWLPISIDSIYKLTIDNEIIVNKPVYCKNNQDLTKIQAKINYISTEDSVSSLKVLRELYSKYNVKFGTSTAIINGTRVSRDNSKLSEIVKAELKSGITNLLVIFDASAYGFFYGDLIDIITEYSKNRISVLAWESFEWFVLSSPPWNLKLTKDDLRCDYNSLEQFSTMKLSELLNYGKGTKNLPSCLTEFDQKCTYACHNKCNTSGFKLKNLLHDELEMVRNSLDPQEMNNMNVF